MRGVAVLGSGQWGRNLVRVFHELGVLRSVCDQDAAAEARVASLAPGVSFTTDRNQLLNDPEVVGVAIATPAVTHAAMVRTALDAGKDVFVEKPLALEVETALPLVELAEAKGRVLMVGHILRYHPALIRLRQLVDSGELGRIEYLYSHRLNIGRVRTEENILWSFAPHDISAMLALVQELPTSVSCQGGSYLREDVADVTVSQFAFPSGVRAHVFVSWLHPFKEQRLVVVGSDGMAVFDDTAQHKLVTYAHKIGWKGGTPTAHKAEGTVVALENVEPLLAEARHFIECLESRAKPVTDGREGLQVLRCLDACQRSLRLAGAPVSLAATQPLARDYFVHDTAVVDDGALIGAGSKIWHFSHVMKGARIGSRCVLGQNVNVDGGASIGSGVKIQNNVSVYSGVTVEDDVFLGPSCVLTNVVNPRSQVNRHSLYENTLLRRGCTVGANATIVCPVTVGRYAFVGAGAVVTRDVPDYALVVGNPARQAGWMSRHGHRLPAPDGDGISRCPESGYRYREAQPGVLRCLDLDEDAPLPAELSRGQKSYREYKTQATSPGSERR